MQQYKLYLLDRNELIIAVRDYLCADDRAAFDEGEKLSVTHAIDIWQADRNVGYVGKNAPVARPTAKPAEGPAQHSPLD